jgi:hypothetical protein
MKLRPSEDLWDRLDLMFNSEQETGLNLNKVILIFSFFLLISLVTIFFIK